MVNCAKYGNDRPAQTLLPGFRFRLRATGFGGLQPAVAREANVGGALDPGRCSIEGNTGSAPIGPVDGTFWGGPASVVYLHRASKSCALAAQYGSLDGKIRAAGNYANGYQADSRSYQSNGG